MMRKQLAGGGACKGIVPRRLLPHRRRARGAQLQLQLPLPRLSLLLLLLSMSSMAAAGGASEASSSSSSVSAGGVCMPGMTAPLFLPQALPFCGGGGTGTPTCCSYDDDAKLHQSFVDDLKLNGGAYADDAECRAALKALICTVCLPSPSPPADPSVSSKTTASSINSLPLPLRCAALATPLQLLLPDDPTKTPTAPRWHIALLASVLIALTTMLGSLVTYRICTGKMIFCSNNHDTKVSIYCSVCHCCVWPFPNRS